MGDRFRELGGEYGATTGRPRRCGWFDAVIVRRALRLNGVNGLCIMKLDVLDHFDTIKICTSYKIGKRIHTQPPMSVADYIRCEPQYEEMEGWKSPITGITEYEDLPVNAKKYLKRLEELLQVRIDIISVGPDRQATIVLRNPFK